MCRLLRSIAVRGIIVAQTQLFHASLSSLSRGFRGQCSVASQSLNRGVLFLHRDRDTYLYFCCESSVVQTALTTYVKSLLELLCCSFVPPLRTKTTTRLHSACLPTLSKSPKTLTQVGCVSCCALECWPHNGTKDVPVLLNQHGKETSSQKKERKTHTIVLPPHGEFSPGPPVQTPPL